MSSRNKGSDVRHWLQTEVSFFDTPLISDALQLQIKGLTEERGESCQNLADVDNLQLQATEKDQIIKSTQSTPFRIFLILETKTTLEKEITDLKRKTDEYEKKRSQSIGNISFSVADDSHPTWAGKGCCSESDWTRVD